MENTSNISQSVEKENSNAQGMSSARHKTVIDYFTNSSALEQVDLLTSNDSQNISVPVDKDEGDKKPVIVIQVIPNCSKPTYSVEQTPIQNQQPSTEMTAVQSVEDLLEDKTEVDSDDNLLATDTKVMADETTPIEMVEEPKALTTELNINVEVPTTEFLYQTEENLQEKASVELIGGKSISDHLKEDKPTKAKSVKKHISKRKILRRRNNLYRNIKSKINTNIKGSKKLYSGVKDISKKFKAKVNKPMFMPFKRTNNSITLGTSVYQSYPKSEIKLKRKPAVPKFRSIKKTIKRF